MRSHLLTTSTVVSAMFSTCLSLSQAAPPTTASQTGDTGTVVGSVVDQIDQPIAGATVTIRGGDSRQSLLTTEAGVFLARLAPGTYIVIANKPGYISEAAAKEYFMELRTEVAVPKGGVTLKIPTLHLFKPAVIAGTVFDDANAPVAGVHVRLLKALTVSGRERFESSPMGYERILSGTTNDRGEYRITAINPGKYVVGVFADRARSISSPEEFGPPLFHPGSQEIGAAVPVVVGVDEVLSGMDFHLGNTAGRTITGRVTGGPSDLNYVVRLVSTAREPIQSEVEFGRVMTVPGGGFEFRNVPDGRFTLSIIEWPRHPDGSQLSFVSFVTPTNGLIMRGRSQEGVEPIRLETLTTYWAEWPLTVDNTLGGIVVPLRTGRPICGRIEFDGSSPRPEQSKIGSAEVRVVRADRTNAELPSAPIRPDLSFCSVGLPDGNYQAHVSGDFARWHLRNVRQGDRNITGEPIEVGTDVVFTFSDREARIDGTVRNTRGEAIPRASVLAFPADQRLWENCGPVPLLLRHIRADATGAFTLVNLPDGDYRLIALTSPARLDWTLLDNLAWMAPSAIPVRIQAGSARTVNVLAIEPRVR